MKRRFNVWPYTILLCLILVIASLVYLSIARQPKPFQISERSWYIDSARYAKSAHGGMDCLLCHVDFEKISQPHPDNKNLNADATLLADQLKCFACHPFAYVTFMGGHERLRPRSSKDIPGCGDCHDIHYQQGGLSRTDLGIQLSKNCGRCHPKELDGYLADYHGKTAVLFGYSGSAYCQDCHGGHDLIPTTRKDLMLKRCQGCHPGYGMKALDYVVHVKPGERADSTDLLRKIKTGMLVFVIVVLAVFYFHMLLWGLRVWHERSRRED